MKLLVEENHDLPIVQVVLAALGGASRDPDGKEGLADMAAELSLRGAAGRDRAALDDAVDSLGGSLSIETEPDYVRLVGRVLARNLDPFLDLVADVLLRPDLPAAELERLRTEMHAGLDDLRDDDRSLAARFHARAVYAGTPYARPADGTHASLDGVSRDDCVAFARAHLAPAPMVAGTAGALAEPDARDRLRARFGAEALAAPPATDAARVEPTHAVPTPGRRLVLVDKPERTQVQLYLGHQGLPVAHPDALALQLGLTAFGGMFSSPLMQEVRVKRGWSYGAGAWLEPRRGHGALTVHLFPANEQAADALRLVLDLIEGLVADGLPDEVIDRARDYLDRSLAMDLDTPEKRASRRLALDVYGLPPDHLETYRARLAAIGGDRALAAVRKYLHPDALVVTAVATAARSLDALAAAGNFAAVERHAYDSF